MKTCKLIITDEVNVRFTGLDATCRRDIVEKMKFLVPYARHMPQFKLGRWDGKVGFATVGGSTYFNVLDRVLPIVDNHGYEIEIDDQRKPAEFSFEPIDEAYLSDTLWPAGHPAEGEPIMLRDHQVRTINTYLENPQCLQEVATGAGKTAITAALSKKVEPYGRSIVIVPGKDLVRQTHKDYVNIGLDVGRFYGDLKEIGHKHTIATWQSLAAGRKNNPELFEQVIADCICVMVDEAHTGKANEIKELLTGPLAHVPLRWGLTGTIPKEDFESISLLCSIGPVVGQVRADELQEKGILAKCKIHITQTVDDVTYAAFDAEKQYLATDRTRVEWLTEFCRKVAETGNTMVLVNSIELGKAISGALDVPFIYGGVKSSKRGEEYDSINDTDNKLIIASFGVAATGISINRLFNLVMVEGGRSHTRIIQSLGRGLRVAKDKDSVDIYDICSTAKFSKRHLKARKEYYTDAGYPFAITKVKYR